MIVACISPFFRFLRLHTAVILLLFFGWSIDPESASVLQAGEKLSVPEADILPAGQTGVPFDSVILSDPPQVFATDKCAAKDVRSLFFEGMPFKGQPTRVFAYYGIPAEVPAEGGRYPAMVLIHGGGGTAYDNWVRLWNSRGYVAIAMDLCGCVPTGTTAKWTRHEYGGPPGWDASFDQLDGPVEDQWTWHAVSAVIRAHSLIRTFPEVDSNRIGVTGISWGGYLTSIVAGVDSRFRFAVPVYGCGFLGENSAWLPAFERIGAEKAALWLRQWDPSGYLGRAKMPILWVNGTNDFAYPMDSWQNSYRLPQTERTLCLRIRMPHAHGPAGEAPEEIRVFADQFLKEGKPLVKIIEQGHSPSEGWCSFESDAAVVNAEIAFTRNTGKWQDRVWESLPATIDLQKRRVSASVPADATVFYLNLFDDRNCAVSTEHVVRSPFP